MFHFNALALPFAALYGVMIYSGWKVLAYPKRNRPSAQMLCDNSELNEGLQKNNA